MYKQQSAERYQKKKINKNHLGKWWLHLNEGKKEEHKVQEEQCQTMAQYPTEAEKHLAKACP